MKKLFFVLLWICGFVTNVFSAELTVRPAAPENRFLFVVETSFATSRSAKAAQNTVRELIESGVQGQMQPGDTFGVWTFNEQLNTEFPMQRWTPGDEKKLAQLAEDFLKKRRYEKKPQLSAALPPVYSVIKSSKAITVILISAGSEPIQGTPFDKVINTIYQSYVRELHDAKLAFVTILVGRNGRPVDYAVNSSLGPIQIPHPPIESEKIAAPPKTNAVAAASKQVSAPKPAEKKVNADLAKTTPPASQQVTATATAVARVEAKPEINTNEASANISKNISTPISAPKVELSTPAVQTNAADLLAPAKSEPPKVASESSVTTTIVARSVPLTKTAPPQTSEPASPVRIEAVANVVPDVAANPTTNTTTVVAPINNSLPNPAKEETASVNSILPDFKRSTSEVVPPLQKALEPADVPKETAKTTGIPAPESKAVANENNDAAPFIPLAKPVVAAQPLFTPKKLLVAGAALLLLAGILVFWLVRHSKKSQPSLISRSIDRSK